MKSLNLGLFTHYRYKLCIVLLFLLKCLLIFGMCVCCACVFIHLFMCVHMCGWVCMYVIARAWKGMRLISWVILH